MIDLDQTGFLKGRSISENFVYATELVQVCNKRKVPTIVLKLDFAKAFDTVSWDALMAILSARGFSPLWCHWVLDLLSSSKSAVLFNGCPGPWIECKRGLRQGDPMSPYLFLLVADVLQSLIKSDGGVRHPILEDGTCAVLQYADDTLVVCRGEIADVTRLRTLLDQFADATGLKINYSKSTAVPMHVPPAVLPECIAILGCRQEGFPQTYLGLPLSNTKLKLTAFSPFVAKADRYLAGWQASLLNPMGRTVLINSVLDSQLVYLMCSLPVPAGALAQVDQRRRAFLWTGEETATGASCLVAWSQVCTDKCNGGLGVRDLPLQNTCLLLKLLHRLHQNTNSSWAAWVRRHSSLADMHGEITGQHWTALRELLPVYRAITTVHLGDGRTTSFWFDVWHGEDPLADRFPALLSHCKRDNQTVAEVAMTGLHHVLETRLSNVAQDELEQIADIIAALAPTDTPDVRLSPFADSRGKLHTSVLYKMLRSTQNTKNPLATFIWRNRAPPRVQFFAWLLVQERVQSREHLKRRHVLTDAICEVCNSGEETAAHIVFHCPFATSFWDTIQVKLPDNMAPSLLPQLQPPALLPCKHFDTFLLLCCWQLWKRRNNVIFRQQQDSLGTILRAAKEEARLWSYRLPQSDLSVGASWCILFDSVM